VQIATEDGSDMSGLADDPEHQLTLRQAAQARDDFAMITDELDFVKAQLARPPSAGAGVHPAPDCRRHSLQHGRTGHPLDRSVLAVLPLRGQG